MLTLPLEAIDKQEALRYMGCPAEPDETLRTVVDTCEQQLSKSSGREGRCRKLRVSVSENKKIPCLISGRAG